MIKKIWYKFECEGIGNYYTFRYELILILGFIPVYYSRIQITR